MTIHHAFLQINDLSIAFGGLKALNKVSFHIPKGKIISLIGPNGAGKTTFLNILTGFLKPQKGSIMYKTEDITGLSPFSIAYRGILRTFQAITLLPNLTVFQNLLTGFHCRTRGGVIGSIFNARSYRREEELIKENALEILKQFEMEKQADVIARNLPYGDQRKLGIAIALAGGPELMLLDEPATGMNPDESIKLMDIIKELKHSGITMLLIEHDMKVVMGISEHIIVLDHGEKIAEGTPQEISQNEDVIKVYLGHGSFTKPERNSN